MESAMVGSKRCRYNVSHFGKPSSALRSIELTRSLVFHYVAGMLSDLTVRHDHTFIGDAIF